VHPNPKNQAGVTAGSAIRTFALDNLVATLERERRRDPNAVLKSAEQVAQLRTLLGQMADLFGQR